MVRRIPEAHGPWKFRTRRSKPPILRGEVVPPLLVLGVVLLVSRLRDIPIRHAADSLRRNTKRYARPISWKDRLAAYMKN